MTGKLPAYATSFVGRERDASELRRLLSSHRLVTLTGMGGTGKTRLSVEVSQDEAAQYPDGAWLIELAAVVPDSALLAYAAVMRFRLVMILGSFNGSTIQ